MAYIVPIHRASSVRHALKLNLLSSDEECLVVAKANRLEIYAQSPEGLALQHTKAIYGKVSLLQKIRPESSQTDHLFVGTDRYVYFTVSWNPQTCQLETQKSYVDVADRSARDSQMGERCHVDPGGRFMTLELFEGIVTVIPIIQRHKKRKIDGDFGNLGEPIPVRIDEFFVRSSAFLHGDLQLREDPKLALLYEDTQSNVRLKIRSLMYSPAASSSESGNVSLEEVKDDTRQMPDELELGASHLIPLEFPIGGLLVLAETSITYLNPSIGEMQVTPLEEATIFVAWERIDSQRHVLADEYGRLYLLMVEVNRDNIAQGHDMIQGWNLDILGETSRASILVYLDAGLIFVGSHQGDSQVIRITEKSMEVVQTFPNIAPILDFTIMDMGNRSGEGQINEYSSGQARIVTGSGAFNDGSLRSVRSGVALEDVGVLGELEHITNLFDLSSTPSSREADTLLVAFINESRVFKFSVDGEVEEIDDYKGIILSETTLLAQNISADGLLQVTTTTAQVIDNESGMVQYTWSVPNRQTISAVSANDRFILVSLGGMTIIAFDVNLEILAERSFGTESQLSCVSTSPRGGDIGFVGFWKDSNVSILDLKTLRTIRTITIADDSVPRSLILTQIFKDELPILFVALADGRVVTYNIDTTTHELSSGTSITLGTQEPSFTELPQGDGVYNVFVSCEHPSLIYGSEGRLVYSAVTAEKATSVCSFDSRAYPGAVAIATPSDLRISVIDNERTTHVQPLAIKETVRRIAYSPTLKAFGMGTIKRSLIRGVEVIKSHFKLADEILFKELDTYELNEDELVESVMRCELDDGTGILAERFVVGTAYLSDDEDVNVRGRIVVLEVTEDRKLKPVTKMALKGGCRCLAMLDGNIVAALIKTVNVYSFNFDTPSTPTLVRKASYRTSFAPIDISVSGNTIAVADLMKSVSILDFRRGKAGAPDALVEVGRHFQTAWGTAVAEVDVNSYLESDAEGNLMVLARDPDGVTEDDRRRLQITSEMLLGEMVNRIRRIDVATTPDAAVVPRAFLATVDGSLYLFALISPSKRDLLITLQSNLAQFVQSPGYMSFNKFRAFKNSVRESEEPYRFVDGELVERFLDCTPEEQKRALAGLNVDLDGVRAMIESLRRLH